MDRREMLKGAAAVAPLIVAGSAFAAANVVRQEVAKIYDPVAVLEAMRDAGLSPCICDHWEKHGWSASIYMPDVNGITSTCRQVSRPDEPFPDFPSAVRWLHEQAAAADAEFAAMWPVPAEVKQDG